MDFSRIDTRRDAEAGATYHVGFFIDLEKTNEEKLFHDGEPIEIDFLGLESKTGKEASARMVKAIDKKSGSKKRSAKDMSIDEILAAASENDGIRARFYAELTTGWRNIPYIADDDMDNPDAVPEILEYNEANAYKLFSTRPWVMEGVDAFLGDRMNFMRKVATG